MIGRKTPAVDAFWQACRRAQEIAAGGYFAGTFADPQLATYHDQLLDLVDRGLKRATAHLELDFARNGIERRRPGDHWVVLDSTNAPRYLIRISDIDVRPFDQVGEDFAAREGEGDSSLAYWRKVHREYFRLQCDAWGIDWREDLPTICEGFDLLASAEPSKMAG